MRATFIALLTASLVLSACSGLRESRVNPFNWFGPSQETRRAADPASPESADPRPLVAEVTELRLERVPGGAILRASALPDRQGYWNAALVPAAPQQDTGLRVYDFRAAAPLGQTATGAPASREITVALFLSDQDLAPVRQIVVRGAQTQRSTRR